MFQSIFDYVDLGAGSRAIKVNIKAGVADFSQYENYHGKFAVDNVLNALELEEKNTPKFKI